MQKVAVAIHREILESINHNENTVRPSPIVKRKVSEQLGLNTENGAIENDGAGVSFPNLRPNNNDPLDNLIHDVTIARNWYHQDTIQQLVKRLTELNKPNNQQQNVNSQSIDSAKSQHRRETKLKPLYRKVLNSHKQAVKMPNLDSQKHDDQGELKVVITQTSPENNTGLSKIQESRRTDDKSVTDTTKPKANTEASSILNTKTHSIASTRNQFVRFSDNSSFVSGTTATNHDENLNSLSTRVRLPILGKRFTNQRNKRNERPLLSDLRRVTHGLYGENFDAASSGRFTYKRQRDDATRGKQKPVNRVTPTLEENSTNLVSKSLAMFQSRSSPSLAPMSSRVASNLKKKRPSVEGTTGLQLGLQDPPNTANHFSVDFIGDREMSQRRLFRQQVAQENVRMFEKDYFYRSFNEIEKPEFGEWLRLYSETNETETPIKIVRSAFLPFTDVPADDIDVTIVPVDGELELRLENKRHHAVERRRRLKEIKYRHMAKSRNKHLAVVENKLAPLNKEVAYKEKRGTLSQQDEGNPTKTKDKKAMPTKVYKIFGERTKTNPVNVEK